MTTALDARDRLGANARLLRHALRHVIRQTFRPAGNEGSSARAQLAGTELFAQDDMSHAQRQHALPTRVAGDPFVGVGAGLRHA